MSTNPNLMLSDKLDQTDVLNRFSFSGSHNEIKVILVWIVKTICIL